VQRIIEAAGQAAAGIIEDAEAQASAYLEESRQRAALLAEQRSREMWGLADELIARAEAIRQQSDELLRALDAATVRAPCRIAPAALPPVRAAIARARAGAPSIRARTRAVAIAAAAGSDTASVPTGSAASRHLGGRRAVTSAHAGDTAARQRPAVRGRAPARHADGGRG
jgi:hypothetical protein